MQELQISRTLLQTYYEGEIEADYDFMIEKDVAFCRITGI